MTSAMSSPKAVLEVRERAIGFWELLQSLKILSDFTERREGEVEDLGNGFRDESRVYSGKL